MKHILSILLLSLSLNTFAQEEAANSSPSLSFSQYVELFAGFIAIASGQPMPMHTKTESEYRAEINQGAKYIIYDIRSDLLIKNWGKE